MWELQGILLYKSIEHIGQESRDEAADDVLVPYLHLIRDPRVNDEEARKLAA